MSNDEPEIVDAEIVESDNLPAVMDQPECNQAEAPIKGGSPRYAAGERDFDRPVADHPRDWDTYAEPARRCAGHKKTGERCKNAAILGSSVCRFHGGAAKHVKAAARARLENATDLMAKQLLGMAIDPNVNDSVKLAAIKDALDRGGLKPPAEVVLSQGESKPYEELFEGISTVSRAESRRARGSSEPESYPPASHSAEGYSDAGGYADPGRHAQHVTARWPEAEEQRPVSPPAMAAEASRHDAPPRQTRQRRVDRERDAQPPVTGADALRIAGQLARQRAIESPHKRYPRP